MIGAWTFSGNANDVSGGNNHGVVNGANLTNDRFGTPLSAYHFDGVDDDIVMMGAGPTGSVSRSISFWARTTFSNIEVPFGYGEAGAPGGIFQIVFNYGCIGPGFDNSQAAYIRSYPSLIDNNWHHVVAVYDASLGSQLTVIKFYIDGVLQTVMGCSTGSLFSLISSNAVWPITLGRSSNSNSRFYSGDLDDFYFYDHALTQDEILQLYNYIPCKLPSNVGNISGPTYLCPGQRLLIV